jgi:glycosyltransferase involved in cell wall biosynthesis
MDNPVVSVVMPVYNGESYLSEAIDSVLNQTFRNFELLIIDDGSTDRTSEIVNSYQDARVRYDRNEHNRGIVYTLNKGIELARGTYVARMDSDDICFPGRLERQIAFMERHPSVDLCASEVVVFGSSDRQRRYPSKHDEIVCLLFFYCCLAHPTVMFCRESFLAKGLLYSNDLGEAEDYELWIRAAQKVEMATIDEPLLYYRVHNRQVTLVNNEGINNSADQLRRSQLAKLGIFPNDLNLIIHKLVCLGVNKRFDEPEEPFAEKWIDQIKWVDYLISVNDVKSIYPREIFRSILFDYRDHLIESAKIYTVLRNLAGSRAIYLWGTGAQGARDLKVLIDESIEAAGFIDKKESTWETEFMGRKVNGPQVISKCDVKPFVVISSMYRDEIAHQLDSFGYVKDIDYIKWLP